ncbi:hypothetical protein [Sinorhizobium americanum]|uniref:hypothetical protein n=1 Tax=Sinorhizobium americanum TaxID=194963 RepID=UPI0007DA0B2F|nr:hypothetical protein [Sinorhizobium americanum]OAP34042.1 hypothetical protein ATC00_28540 [Sinorhizobium americanum]
MLAFLLEIGTRLVTPNIFHDAYSFSGDGWESGDVAHQHDSAEIGDVESAFEVVEKEAGIDHLSNDLLRTFRLGVARQIVDGGPGRVGLEVRRGRRSASCVLVLSPLYQIRTFQNFAPQGNPQKFCIENKAMPLNIPYGFLSTF